MWTSINFKIVVFIMQLIFISNSQKVAPGVNPQQYQYQDPQYNYQQYQQPPVNQPSPIQHQQQPVQHQQPPVQHQQPPVQNQQPLQQQQVPIQQQQVPAQQQVPVQHQSHAHGAPQKVLNAANMEHEKEHIAEHLDVPIDTSKMTEQELQFHYFKMHDADNNNKLDGCELIKSLIHWHEQGGKGPNHVEEKIFKDEELVTLIDPILNTDDTNRDGYIDYPEFIRAQQKAAASAQKP
ncbi:regulator of nonsense transcripts 1 isoform X3 [Agrilus planipennis]|uniref:Regulator of nonsense transcripts 1 isoform X3 n=1 Tax=Agrilus planipennis TaxID=224129 RepID=A0A7F5R5F4_AGRPL|nr:regulator of nonsense transcripts 1 isoform X3 [Agrilus planipennis]